MSDLAPNPFGELLKAHWQHLGLHQAEFCRRIGKPGGWIQQIREAKKTPPLDQMPVWADVLGLTGPARQLFLDAATVMHIPASHRMRFLAFVTNPAQAVRA